MFEYFKNKDLREKTTEINIVPTLSREKLSPKEKKELDNLIKTLKKEVNAIAQKKNTSPSDIFKKISKRIEIITNTDINTKLKEKLLYIQENI